MREDHDIEDIKLAKDDFYRRHLLVKNAIFAIYRYKYYPKITFIYF